MSSAEVTILGIDPGSRITGYGVLVSRGRELHYVASGCIRVLGKDFPLRLQTIYQELRDIIAQYQPHETAIEQVFMHANAGSALKLGQARGAAIVAAAMPMWEYSARQIKQAVVGYGAASKAQIQAMVKHLLKLSGTLQEDAADALAIAICHSHFRQGLGQLHAVKSIKRGRVR